MSSSLDDSSDSTPLPLPDALHSWRASSNSHLLLDLRSSDSFTHQRVRVSCNIPWPELEENWSTLPAQVVPFAILLPNEEEARAQAAARPLSSSSTKRPNRPEENDASNGINKSRSTDYPLGPSSTQFEFSRSNILALLRFYHWRIPDEWVFEDSSAFWKAAAEVGLELQGPNDPIERHILFAPSPYLFKHFDFIHSELQRVREAASSSKQPRSDTALCVATAASSESRESNDSYDTPFACLDIGCGSGRDIAWLLLRAPDWHGTGIDVSASSLERARNLAKKLGVDQRLETCVARINQATGEWRIGDEKITPQQPRLQQPVATPSAGSSSASDIVSLSGAAQRREKRKQKDALRAASSAAAAASSSSTPFLNRQYDLIVMVRFLSRVFFRQHLARLLRPGGFFLLSTFIDSDGFVFESPANPEFRIAGTGEVEKWAKEAGLEVVVNAVGRCEDGRPISETLLRKPL